MKIKNKDLTAVIMGYWSDCIMQDADSDWKINKLLEDFVKSKDAAYLFDDLDRTVENLTNSQKRELYRKMLDSGIKKEL